MIKSWTLIVREKQAEGEIRGRQAGRECTIKVTQARPTSREQYVLSR